MKSFFLSLATFVLASPFATAGFDFAVGPNATPGMPPSIISFDGSKTGALVGSNLAVEKIFDPANPNASVALHDGTLNFSTGAYKGLASITNADGTTSQAWDFAAGGSFVINGDLPGQSTPINLFTGKFVADTFIVQVLGGFNIINSSISGILDSKIAGVFGQAGGNATGGFADLFQANALPGDAISGTEFSGNLGLSTVPEPASLVSLAIGLLVVGGCTYRKRREDARCHA